jgi:hypothetical protein
MSPTSIVPMHLLERERRKAIVVRVQPAEAPTIAVVAVAADVVPAVRVAPVAVAEETKF